MNKILFFCDDFYPNNTGYANAFIGLIDSILNENKDVSIELITTFPLGKCNELKRDNFKIKRIKKIQIPILGYILTSIYSSIFVNKYFFKNKFDLLFVETFDNVFFLSFLSKKICKNTIVRAHSTSDTEYTFYSKNFKYKFRKFLIKNIISKKIFFFASTNNFHINFIKKKYFQNNLIDIGDKFFFVIPNTLKLEKKNSLLEININKIKVMILGRMDALGFNQKGFLDFIISLNLLDDNEISRLDIRIVGSGIKLDYVKQITSKYSNIEFFENLNHKECLNLLHEVDLVILPSRYEGLSMFALESIAFGKICLFSNTGGLVDLIKENGYLFEPQSFLELSISLKKIINLNVNDLMLMKRKSLQLYEEQFSQKQVSEKFHFAFKIIKLLNK